MGAAHGDQRPSEHLENDSGKGAPHRSTFPPGEQGILFGNSVGKPRRRTLFRIRVWRPALVRAGLLGEYLLVDERTVRAMWTDDTGALNSKEFPPDEAVRHLARVAAGGIVFHSLRHSYVTWLVTTGRRSTWCSR